MKKTFTIFLLLTCMISIHAASSGKLNSSISWTLSDDGTLTISGTGDMPKFDSDDWEPNYSPFCNDQLYISKIVISYGITSIGDYTFFQCSNLSSIIIPNSITGIGRAALCGCSKLTSITIPNSVTSIGEGAFAGCSSLTSVTISNSITNISDYAFEGCSGLTSITIPNSVTSIGESAFRYCM